MWNYLVLVENKCFPYCFLTCLVTRYVIYMLANNVSFLYYYFLPIIFYLLWLLVAPSLTVDDSWNDKVVMPAGNSKTYKIPYIGHPEPKISWKYDSNTDLPATVTFSADDKEITIRLKNVIRSDTGVYELEVLVKSFYGYK